MDRDSVLMAAKGGDANAQFTVGFWYHKGENGYDQDERQRNYWYCKSALQGNEEAKANIEMYLNDWKSECPEIIQ
jgi:TPR repeat protein